MTTPREQELWTTAQCAAHCGVPPKVFRDYVSRSPGAPQPVIREPGNKGQNLFLASAVRAWHAARPGQGWWGTHQRRKGN